MSAVSVLVIDCTTIGAPLPTNTPPILTVGVFLRMIVAIAVMQFYHVNTGAFSRQKHENPAKAGSRRTESHRSLQILCDEWKLSHIVENYGESEQHQEHECRLVNALFHALID